MFPVVPEYGKIGEETFKIRENNNYLMKGLASKMLNSDGSLDINKAQNFLDELSLRFGMQSYPDDGANCYDPDNPLETDNKKLLESAYKWLIDELHIPVNKQEDFRRFMHACMSDMYSVNDSKPKAYGNFSLLDVIQKWIGNTLAFETLKKTPEYKNAKDSVKEVMDKNTMGYEQTIDEINKISNIDPETFNQMIGPCACDANDFTMSLFNNFALNTLPQKYDEKTKSEFTMWRVEIGRNDEASKRKKYLEKEEIKVKKDIDDIKKSKEIPGTNPEVIEQYENNLKNKTDELKRITDEIKEITNGPVPQYDFHVASNIGSFIDSSGKKHYLTVEGFAPTSEEFGKNSPLSYKQYKIGVYDSKKAFDNYYFKLPRITKSGMIIDAYKGEITSANVSKAIDNRDKGPTTKYKIKSFLRENKEEFDENFRREPTPHKSIEHSAEKIQQKLNDITLHKEPEKTIFDKMKAVYSSLNRQCSALTDSERRLKAAVNTLLQKENMDASEKNELSANLYDLQRDCQEKLGFAYKQRKAMERFFMGMTKKGLEGYKYNEILNKTEMSLLSNVLKDRGIQKNEILFMLSLDSPEKLSFDNEKDRNLFTKEPTETSALSDRMSYTKADALESFYNKLKADDRKLHFNSSRFKKVLTALKEIKEINNQLKKGNLNEEEEKIKKGTLNYLTENVKENVKRWLLEDNRIISHRVDDFDNNRFNTMFALAYECDPGWAKKAFKTMGLSYTTGISSERNRFSKIDDVINYIHHSIVDNGHTGGKVQNNERWFKTKINLGMHADNQTTRRRHNTNNRVNENNMIMNR
ncbi:MAG: hypothetical protein K5894_08245 [Lachnospiraceae bacterium]|nr:hypothetical protein [Lachnospiraceae bacterium]